MTSTLTRDDVARHANLVPTVWEPTVQAVTNRPHDDAVLCVEVAMRGLGATVYDTPVITLSAGSRGGYVWSAEVGGRPVGRGLAFGVGSALGYGVMAIFDARRATLAVADTASVALERAA